MTVKSRLPELVAEKFGGKEHINYSKIAEATGLTYSTVTSWVKGRVDRADFPVLDKWCKYLNCQVGDILVYEADQDGGEG